LGSSGAHCAQNLADEVQLVPTQIGSRQERSSSVHGARKLEEIGEELAKRKWTWKWGQRWWARREEDEEEVETKGSRNSCDKI